MQTQTAQDFYKDLIDEIAEGIVSVDPDGIIQYANTAASKMVDLPAAKIIGSHFSEFVEKNSLPAAQAFFEQVKSGQVVTQSVINIKDSRHKVFPVEFTASPNIENGRVRQIHTIFRNISERREMEALVRESEKMNAVQHFITGTAQEIRNPLKGLSDKLEKLLEDFEKKDFEYIGYKEFRHIFGMIRSMRDQAKYCFETTQRLLDISKRKIGVDVLSCSANAVLKEALARVRHSLPAEGIDIDLKLSRELPEAKIGAIELTQVLINILTNAIQSITHAGRIVVRTRYAARDNKVVIECSDNGVGISKENLSRIFEPFYTTKHQPGERSSGLGLSIVYTIVKKHKGDVEVKSNLRQGTLVRIQFPAKGKRSGKKR
jgi:PAS domain S-box-containing protein